MVFVHSPKYTVIIIICHLLRWYAWQHWNKVLNLNTHFKLSVGFRFVSSSIVEVSQFYRECFYISAWQGERSRGPMRSLDQTPSDQSEASHEDTRLWERERGRKSPKTSIRVASSNFYLLRLASVWLLIGGDWSCDLITVLWLARRNSSLIISECPGRWQESIGQLPWPPFIVLSNSWEYLH